MATGDSRAVLSRSGVAERLTEDHKPQLPQERSRVEANGGRVDFQRCWRVIVEPREGRPGSGLAVSRCVAGAGGVVSCRGGGGVESCHPVYSRISVALRPGWGFWWVGTFLPHRSTYLLLWFLTLTLMDR